MAGSAAGGHRSARAPGFVLGAHFLSRLPPQVGTVTPLLYIRERGHRGERTLPDAKLLGSGRVQI